MSILSKITRSFLRVRPLYARSVSDFSRPGPPQLPRELQLEFEELQKQSEHLPNPALTNKNSTTPETSVKTESRGEGDVHIDPFTGEQGGPKTEPVGRWGKQNEGDWSFKGRVSDF